MRNYKLSYSECNSNTEVTDPVQLLRKITKEIKDISQLEKKINTSNPNKVKTQRKTIVSSA
jgi:hypothetical protein